MKNRIDKFLDFIEKEESRQVKYERVLVRPTKFKAICGFIFALIFFIICVTMILHSIQGFIITIGDLFFLIYYGSNVFLDKGLGIYKTVPIEEQESQEEKVDEE